MVGLVILGCLLVAVYLLTKGYTGGRISAWLHPENDPLDKGLQVLQSQYAIGSGGLLGLGFEKLLGSPAQTAAQRWPRQCNAIRTCLDRLTQLEAEGSEDLDAVSGCFGELMAELFDYKQDHWSPELRSIGFHLGKFIYLLDAYDDLARDEKKGAYNPLRSLSRQPGYEEEMRDIFELLLARCARSFERLPCVEDADLLRNILYSGVWLKYNCKQAKEAQKK